MFTVLCRHAHFDCQGNILYNIYVLNMKGKHNFKHFYFIYIVETPTQKGEHSWKYTELSLKIKEGIHLFKGSY